MAESIPADATAESAQAFIARCLASGDSRSEIVEALQRFYGVSRATAYRNVARAMLGLGEPDSADIARTDTGSIDLQAEAERQYSAAVTSGDSKAALQWFHILRRMLQ